MGTQAAGMFPRPMRLTGGQRYFGIVRGTQVFRVSCDHWAFRWFEFGNASLKGDRRGVWTALFALSRGVSTLIAKLRVQRPMGRGDFVYLTVPNR
jgi:hypothetical protein